MYHLCFVSNQGPVRDQTKMLITTLEKPSVRLCPLWCTKISTVKSHSPIELEKTMFENLNEI